MRTTFLQGRRYLFEVAQGEATWSCSPADNPERVETGSLPSAVVPFLHVVERRGGVALVSATGGGITLFEAGTVAEMASSSGRSIPVDSARYVPESVRDPFLVFDPERECWHLLAAARDVTQPSPTNACIAWWTEDATGNWRSRSPLFAPGRFSAISCPELFHDGGIWYLIYTVSLAGSTPFVLSDMYQPEGVLYARSYHGLSGSYQPAVDEILLAGALSEAQGRVHHLRTFVTSAGRFADYELETAPAADDERLDVQVSARPLPLQIDPGGELGLGWPAEWAGQGASGLERESVLESFDRDCIQWLDKELATGSVTACLSLDTGWQAGIVVHGDREQDDGLIICLDARYACLVIMQAATGQLVDRRTWFPANHQQELRVIMPDSANLLIYLDGKLMLHQVRYRRPGQAVGLYVKRARAIFSDLTCKSTTYGVSS